MPGVMPLHVMRKNVMNRIGQHLLPLVALLLVSACSGISRATEYGYVFHESTGQNQFLIVYSQKVPFRFDEERSDKTALSSLRALNPRVSYPNGDGSKIIVGGDYDAKTQLLRLEHWYLRVPFRELTLEDTLQMPEDIEEIRRVSLERTDFKIQGGFNPNAPEFDPRDYESESEP
jgi:uncharacterized protein YwqG